MSYFDRNGVIRAELLDKEALDTATSFVVYEEKFNHRTRKKEKRPGKDSLSSSQLRRFFNEFRQLEKKVDTKGFDKVKPLIKMVKSKVSYASAKIPRTFKDFLIKNINNINEEKEFRAFMLCFEAVVGFFYGIEGVKKD